MKVQDLKTHKEEQGSAERKMQLKTEIFTNTKS